MYQRPGYCARPIITRDTRATALPPAPSREFQPFPAQQKPAILFPHFPRPESYLPRKNRVGNIEPADNRANHCRLNVVVERCMLGPTPANRRRFTVEESPNVSPLPIGEIDKQRHQVDTTSSARPNLVNKIQPSPSNRPPTNTGSFPRLCHQTMSQWYGRANRSGNQACGAELFSTVLASITSTSADHHAGAPVVFRNRQRQVGKATQAIDNTRALDNIFRSAGHELSRIYSSAPGLPPAVAEHNALMRFNRCSAEYGQTSAACFNCTCSSS